MRVRGEVKVDKMNSSGRRISIRSVMRNPLDLSKLAKAAIGAVIEKDEAEAQAQTAEHKVSEDNAMPHAGDAA